MRGSGALFKAERVMEAWCGGEECGEVELEICSEGRRDNRASYLMACRVLERGVEGQRPLHWTAQSPNHIVHHLCSWSWNCVLWLSTGRMNEYHSC